MCAKLPKPTAAPPASAADRARGHGNAWARLAARAQKPAARQAAARIAVAQMKRRAAARVAAAYAVREHAAKVAQADKLLGHTPKNAAEAKAQIEAMMKAIAPEVEWQRRRFEISAARLMPKRSDWWTEKRTLQFFKDFREKMAKQGAKDAEAQKAANKKRFDSIPGACPRASRRDFLTKIYWLDFLFFFLVSSSFCHVLAAFFLFFILSSCRCILLHNLFPLSSAVLFT